jgi:pimeloyl-ACP methyl ester carboxylesterase
MPGWKSKLLQSGSAALALAGSLLFLANTTAAMADGKKPFPAIADWSSFFVGGSKVFSDCNDSAACNNPRQGPGDIWTHAAYIEKATPENKKYKYPIVFVHGGGHTGQYWMKTPDGRDGWFFSFLRRGFEVYTVDAADRGRAGWDPRARIKASQGLIPASQMEAVNIYAAQSAWIAFRWGPTYGTLYPQKQFPIQALDQYLAQLVPVYRDAPANDLIAANLQALIDKIGPCILLGWSTGSQNIMDAVNTPARAAQVKALIGVEGFNLQTRAGNIDLNKHIPMISVIGDHAKDDRYIPAKQHADYINSLGGDATAVQLPDIGIFGNGHTMAIEKNNEQIADLIEKWIKKHVKEKKDGHDDDHNHH